ncbi:hypothetical protein SAMN05216548_102358 [Faunimonas pinastri]|uniref:Sulfatase N-terminal domain-containing protein n=1 Tax=Faunimonas pinastri TaxID=1855383 RepID=A0A1H9D5N4_9HYPH|nr:hypothetical protein [Faunimonas pinastri]SEQ08760.1 hypothetical protein SAMN05216548_102358 [Faunimonas pinastri]
MGDPLVSKNSVLFITLDSCRFDSFTQANAPALKAVGPLHKAQAPSYFTYGSHSAMFVGFTPGVPGTSAPILNPKAGKLFKLVGAGFPGKGGEGYQIAGRNIIDGFKREGFRTIGAGAMGWFDPETMTGQHLSDSFDDFIFTGNHGLARQIEYVNSRIAETEQDVFAFVNVGETHVPYWFEGAPWSEDDNPCVPFQTEDRSTDCRTRQVACVEFADRLLAPLLEAFSGSTILLCGDHGDCWGEDGLWEHGVSHWATLTVPLLVRVRGEPVERPDDLRDEIGEDLPDVAPTQEERRSRLHSLFRYRQNG